MNAYVRVLRRQETCLAQNADAPGPGSYDTSECNDKITRTTSSGGAYFAKSRTARTPKAKTPGAHIPGPPPAPTCPPRPTLPLPSARAAFSGAVIPPRRPPAHPRRCTPACTCNDSTAPLCSAPRRAVRRRRAEPHDLRRPRRRRRAGVLQLAHPAHLQPRDAVCPGVGTPSLCPKVGTPCARG